MTSRARTPTPLRTASPGGHARRRIPAIAALLATVVVMAALGGCGDTDVTTRGTPDPDRNGGDQFVPVSTTPAAEATPVLPVEIDGADGRSVNVTDVDRIIALNGNITELVFALGLGERVVGRDISTTFDEAAELPLVTRAHDVSAESVLSLRPTIVLADTDTGPPEALEQIRNVGVPVVVFDAPTGIDDISDRIRSVAEALGVRNTGVELARTTEAQIEQAADRVDDEGPPSRIAFLYMRGQAGVYLLGGEGSGMDSMIDALGATDAGTELGLDRPFTPITSEALVRAAPDVILMTTTGLESVGGIDGLAAIPGIAQTPAGRDRRVITVEDGLLYSFGTRTPEAIAQIAAGLEQ